MSTTLSHKNSPVKNSSTDRNPRPTCPQPKFSATVKLIADESQSSRNPRPSRPCATFQEVHGLGSARKGNGRCRDRSSTGRQERTSDATASPERRPHSPGIAKLQGWLGVRSGVSPKLRRICTSGDEALILNQLVCYWFARAYENRIRARIIKAHHRWVAKSCKEWSDELGMTPKQARRCIEALVNKGFIEVRTWRFEGKNTSHIRPLTSQIVRATDCPEDQRPYRRSDRGPRLTLAERRQREEDRETARNTRVTEAIGRQIRRDRLSGS